jgi:CspA family cold shock protein
MLNQNQESFERAEREMGKGRDRGPRRRGFEDDYYEPPTPRHNSPQSFRRAPRDDAITPSGPAIAATVKWYNAEKGFGFVELADGSGDAFLHVSALQAAGHETVAPETKLGVQVGQGQKGRQVAVVLSVDTNPGAPAPSPRASAGSATVSRQGADAAQVVEMQGTLKFFNLAKGFGFVACDDGGKDVFLHSSVVERSGLKALGDGQRLSMKVATTQKGREAIAVALVR